MKKLGIVIAAVVLIWGFFVAHSLLLTSLHGSEFSAPEELGITYLTPWEELKGFKVLSYGKEESTVYYYGHTGGEKVLFEKKNGEWEYRKTLAIWSTAGSADDYLIFPYYKDFLPGSF